MPRDLYSRYIWLVDTIRRYGSMTRREIDECWINSPFSNGSPLPRRTFFNYRQAIEETFGLEIRFNSADNTYSIPPTDPHNAFVTDWILNSASLTDILGDSREISSHIFLENVPSARRFLPITIQAIKECHPLVIDYHPYSRSNPTTGITLEPYFLKIFRQRWYVTGRNKAENSIKTYALDRIVSARLSTSGYKIPDDFDAEEYFRHSFGIIFNQGDIKDIVLKVDHRQAKYFRALPLHHSQAEEVSDSYSIFTYRMRISEDLVAELLSYGPRITVMRPPELRHIMADRLRHALDNYAGLDNSDSAADIADSDAGNDNQDSTGSGNSGSTGSDSAAQYETSL